MLIIKGANLKVQESMRNVILFPSQTFDSYCRRGLNEDWVNDEFGRKVISDIDHIDVTDPSRRVEDILYAEDMRLEYLATGTKNVLLCRNFKAEGILYNRMGFMGENCFKWLMRASLEKDIYMVTTVFRKFLDTDFQGGEIYFEDLYLTAHNEAECTSCMLSLGDLRLLEA